MDISTEILVFIQCIHIYFVLFIYFVVTHDLYVKFN